MVCDVVMPVNAPPPDDTPSTCSPLERLGPPPHRGGRAQVRVHAEGIGALVAQQPASLVQLIGNVAIDAIDQAS
jgi:hypothetical protein